MEKGFSVFCFHFIALRAHLHWHLVEVYTGGAADLQRYHLIPPEKGAKRVVIGDVAMSSALIGSQIFRERVR